MLTLEWLTTRTGTVSTKEVKTDKYQHHRPCGFMINVVNSIDGSSKPFLCRGEDCMDVFIQKIIEVKDEVMEKMKENKEIIYNANNRRDFNTATKCFICGKDFQQGDRKVRDHCHFTGRYRGVLTMIVIYSLLCVIIKFQFSFIISKTTIVI